MYRYKSSEISPSMKLAVVDDLSTLPVEFIADPEVFSLLMMETKAATEDGRQPFTYFDLCQDSFTPQWFAPEAVGGVPAQVAEDFKFATDQNEKGIMELVTGIGKAFCKTRFF